MLVSILKNERVMADSCNLTLSVVDGEGKHQELWIINGIDKHGNVAVKIGDFIASINIMGNRINSIGKKTHERDIEDVEQCSLF